MNSFDVFVIKGFTVVQNTPGTWKLFSWIYFKSHSFKFLFFLWNLVFLTLPFLLFLIILPFSSHPLFLFSILIFSFLSVLYSCSFPFSFLLSMLLPFSLLPMLLTFSPFYLFITTFLPSFSYICTYGKKAYFYIFSRAGVI